MYMPGTLAHRVEAFEDLDAGRIVVARRCLVGLGLAWVIRGFRRF